MESLCACVRGVESVCMHAWCGEFVCVRECACVVGREGCSSASMCAGGAVVMTPTTHLAISKPYFLPALNHQNRPSLLPAQTLKSYLP